MNVYLKKVKYNKKANSKINVSSISLFCLNVEYCRIKLYRVCRGFVSLLWVNAHSFFCYLSVLVYYNMPVCINCTRDRRSSVTSKIKKAIVCSCIFLFLILLYSCSFSCAFSLAFFFIKKTSTMHYKKWKKNNSNPVM